MAKPACAYCKTVLPHHARAAQQVAVVNQMMQDRNGNGIPDAFEGLIANAPHGQVHLIGTNVQVHGAPPPYGQPGFGVGPSPLGFAVHQQVHVANAVRSTTNAVMVIVVVSMVVVFMVLGMVAGFVMYAAH